jgi:hypothetical protein
MTLDDELESLNVRIRQLRSQFDLFFAGVLPKPPLEARDLLEKEVKRVGTARDMKLPQRFLYNTLLNRWNVFSELWNKKIQEREEGARTPTIARRRAAGRTPDEARPSRDAASAAPEPPSTAGEGSPDATKRVATEKKLVARAAIRDAVDTSGEEMKAFYRSFLEARQEIGGGKAPSYEKFCQEIQRQAQTIRQKTDCEKVDIRLYLEENRVSVKATPVKDKGPREADENRS